MAQRRLKRKTDATLDSIRKKEKGKTEKCAGARKKNAENKPRRNPTHAFVRERKTD